MAKPIDVSLRCAVTPSGMATMAKAMQASDRDTRLLISTFTRLTNSGSFCDSASGR